MFRSISSSRRIYAAFALIVLLALGTAAFFFARQQPVPVTGAVKAVRVPKAGLNGNTAADQSQANQPGQGKWLTTLPDGLQIFAPEPGLNMPQPGPNANVAPSQGQTIDLGEGRLLVTGPDGVQRMVHSNPAQAEPQASAGNVPDTGGQAVDPGQIYRLETNTQGVRVAAPDREIDPIDPNEHIFNLGAGYRLLVTAIGGEIIPPAGFPEGDRQVDLGAGYVLTITGGYGRMNLPNGPIQPEPHDPTVHTEYIGGGFWLVTGMDGDLIFQDK